MEYQGACTEALLVYAHYFRKRCGLSRANPRDYGKRIWADAEYREGKRGLMRMQGFFIILV